MCVRERLRRGEEKSREREIERANEVSVCVLVIVREMKVNNISCGRENEKWGGGRGVISFFRDCYREREI